HGFSSEKIIPVYKRYNDIGHYVAISNADRHPDLHYKATIYNGVKTTDFAFEPAPQDYLLYYGRIHPHKGTYEAIQIALHTRRRLLIAGIIQDHAYFNEKVKPYIDEEQIRYIGPVGDASRSALLGKASALLHPVSFNEPFGLSVAEAMLCGTPVIAFNRGAMPELIDNGKTGFLVNDVAAAIAIVEELSLIDRYACHLHARKHFSEDKMVESYIDLYKTI
ncbi:MAG TPA: glycosyltransferase, partial [Chitinophaga sp.]|uniref:glycosyltransferase n=1 Tax=Chitinophaga sp. TaxID=1869181 RepID=UPI002C113D49